MAYTFIDLFAGVGGIRLAFESTGANCVFSSENDPHCQETYAANFGERPAGDICEIDAADIPDHDVLTGGFPCQPFSIIGRGKGFADTRGTLFFEIERILKTKQPRAFLLENVRQLVSHDDGRTFNVILSHLSALGYHVHWKILNGLDFGVPQKRERVVIVGFQQNVPFQFPTSPVRSPVTLRDVLFPNARVPARYFLSPHVRAKVTARLNRKVYGLTIWHENKSGNIGVHTFSCALRANASYNYLMVNGERRLMPREMFRLQGFPDSFQIVHTDGHARKQAGNSVVIPKIEAVAHAMIQALDGQLSEPQTIHPPAVLAFA